MVDLIIGIVIGLVVGAAAGYLIEWHITERACIGCLREDRSDPDEPYLFLEVDKGGIEKMRNSKHVKLRVKLENYVS